MTDADIATIQAAAKELREYALGVSAHKRGEPFDANRSEAWIDGWLDKHQDHNI